MHIHVIFHKHIQVSYGMLNSSDPTRRDFGKFIEIVPDFLCHGYIPILRRLSIFPLTIYKIKVFMSERSLSSSEFQIAANDYADDDLFVIRIPRLHSCTIQELDKCSPPVEEKERF